MKKLLLLISLLLAVGCTSEYSSKEECLLREQQNCPNGSRDCTGSAYAFCDLWEGDHFTNAYKEEYRAKKDKVIENNREERKKYCEGTLDAVGFYFLKDDEGNILNYQNLTEEEKKKVCDEFL